MKDYKYKQYTFNLLGQFSDVLKTDHLPIETSEKETVKNAVTYLTQNMRDIYFPSKSFAVALIYSTLIETLYGENFWETLNDEHLFCGNDTYFKRYSESRPIYDAILESIGGKDSILKYYESPQILQTIVYFSEEFSVNFQDLIDVIKNMNNHNSCC